MTLKPGEPVQHSGYVVWQSVQKQMQVYEAMIGPQTATRVIGKYAEPHPIVYGITIDYGMHNTTCTCLQGPMLFIPELWKWNASAPVNEIAAKQEVDGHDCDVFQQVRRSLTLPREQTRACGFVICL